MQRFDEHGTPITITADEMGVSPQEVVDKYHRINTQALADLGCSWVNTVDSRGIEYGGALYNRTSDEMHKEIVHEVFTNLMDSGFLEKMTMQQYCSVSQEGEVRFLPDRYVEGQCPECSEEEQGVTSATPAVQHTKPMSWSIRNPSSIQNLT